MSDSSAASGGLQLSDAGWGDLPAGACREDTRHPGSSNCWCCATMMRVEVLVTTTAAARTAAHADVPAGGHAQI